MANRTCFCVCVNLAWWRCVLISPLEEATLLVSWFPTGVEHSSLVRAVLHHCACHRRLITVTPCLPHIPQAVCEPYRGPWRLWGLRHLKRRPPRLWRLLLTWLICPKKKIAAPRVAFVELATLVWAVFAHGQKQCFLSTVTHNDVFVAVPTDAVHTWWRSRLWGPGGDRRKGRSSIWTWSTWWLWSGALWSWWMRAISSSYPFPTSTSSICSTPTSPPCSKVFQVQHLSEHLVTSTDAANKLQRHHGREASPAEPELQPEEQRTKRRHTLTKSTSVRVDFLKLLFISFCQVQ